MLFTIWFAAALTWTGNESCRPCHRALYDHYVSTPMARTSGPVDADITPGKFRHKPSGVQYSIDDNGRVHWSTSTLSGVRQLNYYIGSGMAGRSYLFVTDNFLFQAPVTWYTQQKRWDVSPGYEADRTSRWSRPIEPNCLYCHASQARPIYGTQNRYADPPFAQSGVACERCHGPGSEHILGRGSMINPAKLGAAERDSVCSQCHLSGAARIEKAGRRIAENRAGNDLNDFVAYFVPAATDGGAMRATSHMEKLEASACKKASGDKLWCGTCHSPHQTAVSKQAACMSCHPINQCGRGEDCTSCHMPKAKVVDGGHGVLTDHSIPRRAMAKSRKDPEWRLEPFRGFTATTRELGLAYAEAGETSSNSSQLSEAERLMRSAPADAAVLTRLGKWEAALKADPNSVVAMVNLGVLRAAAGDHASAESLWRQALQRNPGLTAAGVNLVTLLQASGRTQQAEKLLQQLRMFEPQLVPAKPR
ncbi:MAG TPA: tetratricopeptide repeat protein [Bryobacteraceae bacterium]|nr:tetratricopeptide repeat protein [Bryobacteraceae bacterium]